MILVGWGGFPGGVWVGDVWCFGEFGLRVWFWVGLGHRVCGCGLDVFPGLFMCSWVTGLREVGF